MPLYEYECSTCGQVIEASQRMSDPPLTNCECGEKGSLRRLLSAGNGLIFKGSGFYITDYKNGNGNGSSSNATESKSEAKSESKTETKSESAPKSGGCGTSCGCD